MVSASWYEGTAIGRWPFQHTNSWQQLYKPPSPLAPAVTSQQRSATFAERVMGLHANSTTPSPIQEEQTSQNARSSGSKAFFKFPDTQGAFESATENRAKAQPCLGTLLREMMPPTSPLLLGILPSGPQHFFCTWGGRLKESSLAQGHPGTMRREPGPAAGSSLTNITNP